MNIFNRRTRPKHIERFGLNIAELLKNEFPQLKKAIGLSKVHGINFMENPQGISVSKGYGNKVFEEINRNHKTRFNLTGILIWNRIKKTFEPVKLFYNYDTLNQIEIENPRYFHKIFDLDKIEKKDVKVEHLTMVNSDQKIAEKALKSLTKEQLKMLELDSTFEIELDQKLYYTILDMEDGNYFAVDKNGKIYRLNHDHEERIRVVANKPSDFFKIYNGNKSELEKIMHE